jgi:hypothetical protein
MNEPHRKSWVIEVTNDRSIDISWIEIEIEIEIDCRTNNVDLKCPGIVQTFRLLKPRSQEFLFIRNRQIGVNHRGGNYLGMSALEFFVQLRIRTSTAL